MLYAVINAWTGEIKCMSVSLKVCEQVLSTEMYLGEECVIAKVYPDMLMRLGTEILKAEGVSEDVEVLA